MEDTLKCLAIAVLLGSCLGIISCDSKSALQFPPNYSVSLPDGKYVFFDYGARGDLRGWSTRDVDHAEKMADLIEDKLAEAYRKEPTAFWNGYLAAEFGFREHDAQPFVGIFVPSPGFDRCSDEHKNCQRFWKDAKFVTVIKIDPIPLLCPPPGKTYEEMNKSLLESQTADATKAVISFSRNQPGD